MRCAEQAPTPASSRKGTAGFALILALLTLMLLTFLGLTLATTTSSELQIAANHRWSEQAYYNAEAGIEAAKLALKSYTGSTDLALILPQLRTATWTTSQPAAPVSPGGTDAWGTPLRQFENSSCDLDNVGYGVILNPTPGLSGPMQYVTTFAGQTMNGAFTVWIRRARIIAGDGTITDDTSQTEAIITSEGVAPFTGGNVNQAFGQRNRAVRVLSTRLSIRADPPCEAQRGQTGFSSTGSGFSPCALLTSGALADEFGGGPTGPTAFGNAAR
jgi:hypothetical protein